MYFRDAGNTAVAHRRPLTVHGSLLLWVEVLVAHDAKHGTPPVCFDGVYFYFVRN